MMCSHLRKLSDLLLNADVDVRISAGEAIALLYEMARADDEVRCNSLLFFKLVASPCVAGAPLFSPLSINLLIFSPIYFSLSFIGFTYFLLLSISSLSTRIVPLRFQAGGRRKRPNLCLVCWV